MMGIRVGCFILTIGAVRRRRGLVLGHSGVGALVIPYFAVVFANGGREPSSTRGFRAYEPNLPERYSQPGQTLPGTSPRPRSAGQRQRHWRGATIKPARRAQTAFRPGRPLPSGVFSRLAPQENRHSRVPGVDASVWGFGVAFESVLWSPVGAPAGVPGPRRNADDCDAGWFAPVATRRRPMLSPFGASPRLAVLPGGATPRTPRCRVARSVTNVRGAQHDRSPGSTLHAAPLQPRPAPGVR